MIHRLGISLLIILLTIGCTSDDTSLRQISFKVNGEEIKFEECVANEDVFNENFPILYSATTVFGAPDELIYSKYFTFGVVQEDPIRNHIFDVKLKYEGSIYEPDDTHSVAFEISTNNDYRLRGTFSGNLITHTGHVVNITEGQFTIDY